MTCVRCGADLIPTRQTGRLQCPYCPSAHKQAGGRRTRQALRVLERPALQAHFRPRDVAETPEYAWRVRTLAAAYRGDPDALLALWDVLAVRLPLVEARVGWVPPRGRPARAGGGRPWLAEIGA